MMNRWFGSDHRPKAEFRPYAVVVSLAIEEGREYEGLEEKVRRLLEDRPDLGYVDGAGSDGETWELSLDGEDATALWDAVRSVVTAADPAAGSTVRLRANGETHTEPIDG